MREAGPVLIMLLVVGAIFGICFYSVTTYMTYPTYVLLSHPTPEQIQELYQGEPENRVWAHGLETVIWNGSEYIEMRIDTRSSEQGRALEWLDSLGVDYVARNSDR